MAVGGAVTRSALDCARWASEHIGPWLPAAARATIDVFLRLALLLLWVAAGAALMHRGLQWVATSDDVTQIWLLAILGVPYWARSSYRAVRRAFRRVAPPPAPERTPRLAGSGALPGNLAEARRVLLRGRSVHWTVVEMVLAISDPDELVATIVARADAMAKANARPGRMSDQRRARHEAAHAVVAHHSGLVVTSVNIAVSGSFGGRCNASTPPATTCQDAAMAQLQFAVAGARLDQRSGDHDRASESDFGSIAREIAAIQSTGLAPAGFTGPLTFDALIAHAMGVVDLVLDCHGEQIDEIADRLTARRQLAHHDIRDQLAIVRPIRTETPETP